MLNMSFGGNYLEKSRRSRTNIGAAFFIQQKDYTKTMSKEKLESMSTEAEIVFERIAQRLDVLMQKENLNEDEQKELDLLFNNAMVLQEILEGKKPEEF